MTFEERLDRLTERHEALTQSVELLLKDSRENTENIRVLFENSRVQGESIRLMFENSQVQSSDIQSLSEYVRGLVRTAEIHERRITKLEGGE
jgi:hypothetical protein